MCGIAGILYFGHGNRQAPVGHSLSTMAQCLQHRGADSAGVAVFSGPSAKTSIQVVLPAGSQLPEPQFIDSLVPGQLSNFRETSEGFSADISPSSECDHARSTLVGTLERRLPGSVVTALGSSLSVYKTVGRVLRLFPTVEPLTGTHGIAHLRLATESKIDPAHAQPFWGRPFADIAVTHNGHITNYYKLRQKMEARGLTFASQNDSEIIGIMIGEKLSAGLDLTESLEAVLPVLDGSYSFIVATANGLGVARDRFATKPLLYIETDKMLSIASEQQALRRLSGEHAEIKEIQPKEFRTWEKV
jgi:glutamine phosphoribosylpyrophosphate amidotransferase